MRCSLAIAILALSCSTAPQSTPSAPQNKTAEKTNPQQIRPEQASRPAPVLVELFTSQGCSSCPPADELLSVIDQHTDVEVVALSFHVDYWDHLGWRDPYSSKQATVRQRDYASRIAKGHSYTPQLVVSGSTHTVGSREHDVIRDIESAAGRPASGVQLTMDIVSRKADEVSVILDLATTRRQPAPLLYVALYESGLETQIRLGENTGRTLRNDYVVRRLQQVDHEETSLTIRLDPAWQPEKVGVVAFAQDPTTLEILAVDR